MKNLVKIPQMEAGLEAAFLRKLVPSRGTSGDKSEWLSGVNARELKAKLKVRSCASTSTWMEEFGGLDPNSQGLGFSTRRGQLGSADVSPRGWVGLGV